MAAELDRAALEGFPLPPLAGGDKNDRGRLLVIAGSRGLPGAALLCALAAMRAGTGKLKIATAASIAPQVGVAMPESRTIGLAESADDGFAMSALDQLLELASMVDAVVAGPGIAESAVCAPLAGALLKSSAACALDAGMLRALPGLEADSKAEAKMPLLLPHAGELAALLCCEQESVEEDPAGCARKCAARYNAITVAKGAASHIAHPDGRVWTYGGGGPGLGVSGSGDVLAGIVGGLLARGADPLTAMLWGVWLHGEAGRALAKRVGPLGFLAREIPAEIPALLAHASFE